MYHRAHALDGEEDDMHGDLRVESHPDVQSLTTWQRQGATWFADAEIVARNGFAGSAWSVDWGGYGIARVEAGPHRIDRSDAHTRTDPHDRILLSLQLGGRAELVQDGRRAELLPGDVVIADASRPSTVVHHDTVACITALVPRSSIAIGAGMLAQLTAVALPAGDPVADLAQRSVRIVHESLAGLPAVARTHVVHTVGDLVSAICLRLAEQRGLLSMPRNADLFDAVLQYAESRLWDPDLSVERIAKELFVSVRSVYRLAAERDLSLASWIRTRRLEHCRAELADPAFRSVPIAAIAARWGMSNAPRFSTAFRSEFGLTPREHRRMHLSANGMPAVPEHHAHPAASRFRTVPPELETWPSSA